MARATLAAPDYNCSERTVAGHAGYARHSNGAKKKSVDQLFDYCRCFVVCRISRGRKIYVRTENPRLDSREDENSKGKSRNQREQGISLSLDAKK